MTRRRPIVPGSLADRLREACPQGIGATLEELVDAGRARRPDVLEEIRQLRAEGYIRVWGKTRRRRFFWRDRMATRKATARTKTTTRRTTSRRSGRARQAKPNIWQQRWNALKAWAPTGFGESPMAADLVGTLQNQITTLEAQEAFEDAAEAQQEQRQEQGRPED
jgi:hypothetical protein